MRSISIITALIFLLSVAACGQISLGGTSWTLDRLRGVDTQDVDAYIAFDASGGRFTGETGCNLLSGSVRRRGTSTHFAALVTTKRACMRETSVVERGLLSAFRTADRIRTTGDRLRIYSGRVLLAEFITRREPTDDEPPSVGDNLALEDREWVLVSVEGSAVPGSLTAKPESTAFIKFHPEKGSAGGNSGCNSFGGRYTAEGNRISITKVISTLRACIEDERMDVERMFLDGLRSADRFEIRADTLFLFKGKKELLSFRGRKR